MNILMVAPTTNLPYQTDELQALLQSDHQITPLIGAVTVRTLVAALQRRYDIIWFAAHSNEAGILLSDGYLTTKDLVPLVQGCRLLLLNSCASVEIAAAVCNATAIDVIGSLRAIEDRSAFRFGATFVQNLKRYAPNFKRAFDASVVAGDSDYVYLRSEKKTLIMDDLTKALYELKIEIALLTQRVRTLEVALKRIPSQRWDHNLLRMIMAMLVGISMLIGYGVFKLAG